MADPLGTPRPSRRVLVLGDANVDLTLHVPARLPDGRREVREPVLTAGGTAANTARGLGSLGVPVAFAGAVGDDAFGRRIASDLAACGVDIGALVVTREADTCQVIAMLEPDGERSLVVWPPDGGALRWLRPGDVAADVVAGAAWLHTTGMCLRDLPVREAVLAAMAEARAAGVPVSIDLNLRVELWGLDAERRSVVERAVALADVVLGSGPEELVPLASAMRASRAAGAVAQPGDAADADDADSWPTDAEPAADAVVHAARDLTGGTRTVVARLGGSGVLACAPDGSILHSPAFKVKVANIIGAGDAFNAGFIAAMVEGRGLPEALRWGNAVAARKVARPVGATDLPTRAEVVALLG